MSIDLIALGGTISMTETPTGAQPALAAKDILGEIGTDVRAFDLAHIGGSQVSFALLLQLYERIVRSVQEEALGVVVTAGTDAIEEIGMWLSFAATWTIPVVITGSMVPGSSVGSDAPLNLSDALKFASSGNRGAFVVFDGEIFTGHEVLKTSGIYRQAFAAPGRGAIGHVCAGTISMHRDIPILKEIGVGSLTPVGYPIISVGLDDDGALIRHAGSVHSAVVIAANGAGNLPPRAADATIELLEEGKLVVICSRTPDATSAPMYGYPGGSAILAKAGACFLSGVSAHKARMALALASTHSTELSRLRELLERVVDQPRS